MYLSEHSLLSVWGKYTERMSDHTYRALQVDVDAHHTQKRKDRA